MRASKARARQQRERDGYPHPATHESFTHYSGLQESSRYLPINQLEDGCIYLIHARNSYLGIWRASDHAFTLVREKFGRRFLSQEFHWDTGAPFGTAKPFVKVSGMVEPERRRQALDEAEAQIPYQDFMARTREFIDAVGEKSRLRQTADSLEKPKDKTAH